MILTITASPTIDVTYKINSVNLQKINRVNSTSVEASGKGINVSSALADQNIKTEAIVAVPNSSIARGVGAKIAIDTSGSALKHAISLAPDFIKPNLDELIEINPEIADNSQAIKDYVVVLSMQINGVVLCTNGGEVGYASNTIDLLEVTPLVINGANSVGAGDAAVAGYLAGETSGSDFASAVKTAMSWASAACQNKKTSGLNNQPVFKEGAKIRSITPSNLSA